MTTRNYPVLMEMWPGGTPPLSRALYISSALNINQAGGSDVRWIPFKATTSALTDRKLTIYK